MAKEKTITELYEFLQEHMVTKKESDERFEKIDKRFKTMASKEDLANVKEDLKKMELDLKDYIDDKLGELKGDLIVIMRKEDKKFFCLVELLKEENVIDNNKIKKLLKMGPFPKLVL